MVLGAVINKRCKFGLLRISFLNKLVDINFYLKL